MSVMEELKRRINDMDDGKIMMTSDFADLASITTIRKCLGRCVNEGLIRRIFDGVYEKPKYSSLLEEYLPADPEEIAYALAKAYHWTIAPCEDIALNKLGLSTQVPAVWSYVSDGPYREYSWGSVRLKFKHRANREISMLSPRTVLVIEAIRALGKDGITEDIIAKLQRTIPETDKKLLLTEAMTCSEWIYEDIRKVCSINEKNCRII